ncbi:MAG: hypothetical protein NTY19_27685 [Planctomycetota bacterium]|nr:hypothetical protein [Planctomycetota bacterium]
MATVKRGGVVTQVVFALVAVLAFGAAVFSVGAAALRDSQGHRFKDDNAMGATANAVEDLLGRWSPPYFGYALLAILIVAVDGLQSAVLSLRDGQRPQPAVGPTVPQTVSPKTPQPANPKTPQKAGAVPFCMKCGVETIAEIEMGHNVYHCPKCGKSL